MWINQIIQILATAFLLLGIGYLSLQLHLYYNLKDAFDADFSSFARKLSRAVSYTNRLEELEANFSNLKEKIAEHLRESEVTLEKTVEYEKRLSGRLAVAKHREEKKMKEHGIEELKNMLDESLGVGTVVSGSDIVPQNQMTIFEHPDYKKPRKRKRRGRRA